MNSVAGMPDCRDSLLFGEWPKDQPKTGFEIQVYQQKVRDPTATRCKGIEKHGRCYEYVVLTEICMVVRLSESLRNGELEWKFVKGCFEGKSIAQYERAEPGKVYDFSDVKVHIKVLNDPTNNIKPKNIIKAEADKIFDGKEEKVLRKQSKNIKMIGGENEISYIHWLTILFAASFWITCLCCCISCCWINWIDHK